MTKAEFENEVTPKVLGCGGGVTESAWRQIEAVYMNTNLDKVEVADCFWNHTGRFSSLAYVVRVVNESKARIADAKKRLAQVKAEVEEAQLVLHSAEEEIRLREGELKHRAA